jgi:hypothetical protein
MKYSYALMFMLVMGGITAFATKQSDANICGTVTVCGKPMADVVVSDGVQVAVTDAEGRYALTSDKVNGWVYVSIPSGYEVPVMRGLPQFYALTTAAPDELEQHDFQLVPVDQSRFKLLAVSDMHLADRFNDLEQFSSSFVPSIKREIDRSAGMPVYTLNLGDMSFDAYWYANDYDISNYRKTIEVLDYPTPIFHVPGNHDHDGAVAADSVTNVDFQAIRPYVKALGPNYYSFNVGGAHVVMLDNIVYENNPGGKRFKNIKGARDYEKRVTDAQLEWLRRDLEMVKDKDAPIFVGMHSPAYKYVGATDSVASWFSKPQYSEDLSACFDGFTNVHFVSGHIHNNNTVYAKPNITEHNIAAVCGVWWLPGSLSLPNICPSGAPVGFESFNVSGNDVDWQFVGIVEGDNMFRAYDINAVKKYYDGNPEMEEFLANYPARDLRNEEANVIYVNVYDYAPDWTVRVVDCNGNDLDVEHKLLEDPCLTVFYHLPQCLLSGNYPKSKAKATVNHMFRAVAPDATSPVSIIVTDRFGRSQTQTLIRPAAFPNEANRL